MARIFPHQDRDALLVIDVQNDFCFGGALEVHDGQAVVPVINSLMPAFSQIVLTQDWHPANHHSFASAHEGRAPFDEIECAYGPQTLWPDHCVQGSHGAEFHAMLVTHRARLILRKGTNPKIDSYSGFFENDHRTPTGLGAALKAIGVRRIFLTGLATDFCVFYTARDARRLGLEAILIEDACRAIDLEGSLEKALTEMQQAGVERTPSSQFG